MRILTCLTLVACVVLAAIPALALDEIYSPNAEEGEFSFEYNASRTFDAASDKNNLQTHELVAEYGLTNRWMVEASAGFEKDAGEASRLVDFEVENRFQFFEQGEYWVDSGLLVAYDHAVHHGDADDAEIKLLLQKDTGRLTHTANIGFTQELGGFASGGPDFVLLWNSRYRLNEYVQPGVELQSDFGSGPALSRYSEQGHYIGPALQGKLFGHLHYEAAWLAGISDSSSSSAARVLLEYEMHF